MLIGMRRSTRRILTTHTGSLPRPDDVLALLKSREEGSLTDRAWFDARVRAAVDAVVREQADIGLDVINDGELGKIDYSTYIKDRFTGFGGPSTESPLAREAREFPEVNAQRGPIGAAFIRRPMCTAPIEWKDFGAVERDIQNLAHAASRLGAKEQDRPELFMTAVSPGQASRFLGNRHYPSHEAYLRALGNALKREYDAIAEAGFILQVDCPDLGSGWNSQFPDATLSEFRAIVALHLEVLDDATRDVPPERLRLHLCWGNYNGPHTADIPLASIIDLVLRSRAQAVSFEGANPRHEHEWRLWREVKLPPGKVIIPGVIDSCTSYVEHPELVAQRICGYASLVGRENIIAGVDCGFGTFAGRAGIHPTVVAAKLRSLVDGARLATKTLW
jgi:5-methyltetrahydropteroyltriglutamate--homocysteine methyltransferase